MGPWSSPVMTPPLQGVGPQFEKTASHFADARAEVWAGPFIKIQQKDYSEEFIKNIRDYLS